MGSPGRVVRELDEAAIAAITASALHYQQNSRAFRDNLKALTS
jgi:carbonic anhydrase/acetyltransferase-like protein (isoleucine patch superfamily)